MKSKIVINPKYEHLRDYIETIGEKFDSLGSLLEARRNVLRQDTVQGVNIVIKSFKRIYLPNRIRYTYYYPSKAQRAFDYANALIEKGFNTPQPVAYIEVKESGLISESFFISEYLDYQPIEKIIDPTSNVTSEWVTDLAEYSYRLHRSNIYHVDYTVGNILYKKINGKYDFALVDNNRMKFGSVSFRKGLMNFTRLRFSLVDYAVLAKEYARMWQIDEIVGVAKLFHYRAVGNSRVRWKVAVKRFFKGSKKK